MNHPGMRIALLVALLGASSLTTAAAQPAGGGNQAPAKSAAKGTEKSAEKGPDKSADKAADKGSEANASTPADAAPANQMKDKLSALFGSGFRKLTCGTFDLPPDGIITILDSVDLKTDQLTIQCDKLTVDPDSKIMVAVGRPVKLNQAGIKAECNLFTYDIGKKKSTLEQHPVMIQTDGEKSTRMAADHIILTQDANGKMGFHMVRDAQNPGGPVTIEADQPAEKKPGDAPKSTAPIAVTGEKGPSLIKIPGTQ